jgi:hypothetical protein
MKTESKNWSFLKIELEPQCIALFLKGSDSLRTKNKNNILKTWPYIFIF